ncbi:hypothetical protein BASA60_001882 [Batrachochytrium salamandrivorans]|nr:hypothetical protein BASA60_001882 [Batrachochytrium salamandrivorans]
MTDITTGMVCRLAALGKNWRYDECDDQRLLHQPHLEKRDIGEEAKVDSLVQGVDNVRTEVEGTRVDIDTVVEGADSEMCSVKEYLKAVASSSAIIMSKLEVLGSSPHVPQFLNQPSYAMMASHSPANTPTTRTAVRKPSAVTVAAPASLVPPVKITRGGILNTPLPTMSHQAARVLLRTEPEQQASVTARFQKHQAATRSQILPPAALPCY